MGSESIHKKLERVRKPHVHIQYEVEIGDAIIKEELPFVMGVVGDFTGNNPGEELKPLKDRRFISIDRDNFNEVMARLKPGLSFRVENTIQNDGTEFGVQLQFKSMDDFEPANIISQVPPLKELFETRNKLRDLMSFVDRSSALEGEMEQLLKASEELPKSSDGQQSTGDSETKKASNP